MINGVDIEQLTIINNPESLSVAGFPLPFLEMFSRENDRIHYCRTANAASMRMSDAKITNGWRSVAGSTRSLLALKVHYPSRYSHHLFLFKKVDCFVFSTLSLPQWDRNSISHSITTRATIQDNMKWIMLGLVVPLAAAGRTGNPAVSKSIDSAPSL